MGDPSSEFAGRFFYGPRVIGSGPRMSPTTGQPVRVASALYEFRTSDGEVFGYPREVGGKLVLPVSGSQHKQIATEGLDLQVWVSGRPLDDVGAIFLGVSSLLAPQAAAASAAVSSTVSTPTVPVDPAAPGKLATKRLSYSLRGLNINSTDFPVPLEVVGEVTQPESLKSGVKYPLVLFLHGRHATCYQGGPEGSDTAGSWPCPDGYDPIPSHEGYRYVADILASHGYVVVSISANGINGQDYAARDLIIKEDLFLSGLLRRRHGGKS